MKRYALMLLTLLIAFGVQGASAQGRGSGNTPFTATYYLDATTQDWQSTGIVVNGGVSITATGAADCDVNTADEEEIHCVNQGPDGNDWPPTPNGQDWASPGLKAYSLVGSIDGGTPFFIGSGPIVVTGQGELSLAYNDNIFTDNDGGFTVTVTSCRPGNGNGDSNHCHYGPPGQN